MKATGCGREKVQETYKCNEVKVEVESANSNTVEVTAATFTRRRINHGYMATCAVFVTHNSSKSGIHEYTHGYHTCIRF